MLLVRFAGRLRDCVCWRRFLLVVSAVAAMGLLLCFSPVECQWFPPCPFRSLTGWYCPGCGSTRALHHLLHGKIGAAFGYNPLMVASVPFLLVRGVARWVPGCALRVFDEKALRPAAIIGICVLVVVYGVLRNLPAYPFSFLAPHG